MRTIAQVLNQLMAESIELGRSRHYELALLQKRDLAMGSSEYSARLITHNIDGERDTCRLRLSTFAKIQNT